MNKLATQHDQTIENQRIETFREKQISEQVSIKYEQRYDPDKKQVFLQYTDNNIDQSAIDNSTHIASVLCAAFGTASNEYIHVISGQTLNAQFVNEHNAADKANGTIEALVAMGPKDIIEGQLCSRLIVLTDQYNEYMRRAVLPNQPLEIIERYLNCATKLMRIYNDTLDTLNRYRRKGEQKFTVQYVNINGGQAVVTGQLNQAGGGDTQKDTGVPHVQ